jgi:hypothetical protein
VKLKKITSGLYLAYNNQFNILASNTLAKVVKNAMHYEYAKGHQEHHKKLKKKIEGK